MNDHDDPKILNVLAAHGATLRITPPVSQSWPYWTVELDGRAVPKDVDDGVARKWTSHFPASPELIADGPAFARMVQSQIEDATSKPFALFDPGAAT